MPVKYNKLFSLMDEKKIRKRYLRLNGVHAQTVDNLIKDRTVDTATIGKLCALLECQPGDIMEYVPEANDSEGAE